MTTDAPGTELTALEGRLFLVAALALGYVLAWFGVAPRTPAEQAAPAPAEPGAPAVWLSQGRPHVKVPKGWELAADPTAAPPRLVTPARAPRSRVRTRSS